MSNVVIVSAVRTAIGSFQGSLKDVDATALGSIVIDAALKKVDISPSMVDEVIMGNVLQAGLGQNPARQAAIKASLPISTTALTINKVCGSGLKAVHLATQAIMAGDADVIVAGGFENMSQAPHLLTGVRQGTRLGNQVMVDSLIQDGLWCAFNDYHMGVTAENVASMYNISRLDQDEFAVQSQQRASTAQIEGRFNDEIVPVYIPQKKEDALCFDQDEFIKKDTSVDKLANLKAAFKSGGSVTAGNASGINDGAAALVLMSEEKANVLGIPILAKIVANASAGVDPSVMGTGPIAAVNKVLEKAKTSIENIDLIEANEAFAAQALTVQRELGLNADKVNVNGGAIALGHPIGASGARILVTLIHEMHRRKVKTGLATLCIGGGQGIATIIQIPE